MELAHPFNKGFDRVHEYETDEERDKILQGNLDFQVTKTETVETSAGDVKVQAAAQADAAGMSVPATNGTSETETAEDGKKKVYSTTYYVGIGLKATAKSLDLSYAITDYKNVVTQSDLYNADMHSIRVVHVRKYALLKCHIFENAR